MKRAEPRQSWFETLRRDRRLFALVGTFALLLGLLQPLATARGSAFQDFLVLCSAQGAPADENTPVPGSKCPLCVIGHICAFHAAPGVLSQFVFIPRILQPGQRIPAKQPERVFAAGGLSPPCIRAPPLSA